VSERKTCANVTNKGDVVSFSDKVRNSCLVKIFASKWLEATVFAFIFRAHSCYSRSMWRKRSYKDVKNSKHILWMC